MSFQCSIFTCLTVLDTELFTELRIGYALYASQPPNSSF